MSPGGNNVGSTPLTQVSGVAEGGLPPKVVLREGRLPIGDDVPKRG